MNRNERNSERRNAPTTSGDTGRAGHRRRPEPEAERGRQPEKEDNRRRQESDEEDMEPEGREKSPEDRQRKEDQIKDRSRRNRGRWKEAGEDEMKKEKRHARQERMKKVMRLFEDSLLIDKVAWKDRKKHMDDVRERLDELKKEHAQRMKEEVTSHWTKLTEEGRKSRASENDDDGGTRPAKSERLHNREKNRYMSGEESDEESPREVHPRAANSGDGHNRARNRVMSSTGQTDYKPKGDNRKDRDTRGGGEGSDTRRNDKPIQKPHQRVQDSGNVHNRNRNRVRSGEAVR